MTDHGFVKKWENDPLLASSLTFDRCDHCGNFQVVLLTADGKTPFAVGEFSPADAVAFCQWIAEAINQPRSTKTVN